MGFYVFMSKYVISFWSGYLLFLHLLLFACSDTGFGGSSLAFSRLIVWKGILMWMGKRCVLGTM